MSARTGGVSIEDFKDLAGPSDGKDVFQGAVSA